MDPGRAGTKTPLKAAHNTIPIASKIDSTGFTAPTGSGGYSTTHVQSTPVTNTGSENLTPNSQYGQAVGRQTGGYNVSMVQNHLMDQNHPPAQYQPIGPNYSMVQSHCVGHNHAMAPNQPVAQNRPMVPNYPVAQNPTNVHYQYTFQVPKDDEAALRTRYQQYQRQMLANAQAVQAMNQVRPSADTQATGNSVQPAQPTSQIPPAQPVSPQQVTDGDVEQVREWLEEQEITFQGRIRNFQDAARYREAERRVRQELTPDLANDYPTGEAEQLGLAQRLFNAFMVWSTGTHTGWTRQAINKVRLQANFIIELTAWQLLESARDAQRSELLLSDKYSIEKHGTFMERFEALEEVLSSNVHLAGSAFDSSEWVDRIAGAPKLEFSRKQGNREGNGKKNDKLKFATRIKRANPDIEKKDPTPATSSTANTTLRRSSRRSSKRAKLSHEESTVEEDDSKPQTPANHGKTNAKAPTGLCKPHQPVGQAYNHPGIANQTRSNNQAQANDHNQGRDRSQFTNQSQNNQQAQVPMSQGYCQAPEAS